MKKLTLIVILILLNTISACTAKKITYYRYNNTTITRVDNKDKIYFYYGRIEKEEPTKNRKGIVYTRDKNANPWDYMLAYIKFNNDQTVEIIPYLGNFSFENKKIKQHPLKLISADKDSLCSDIFNETRYYENIISVTLDQQEDELRNKGKTKVEISYK